jgi:transaldolase
VDILAKGTLNAFADHGEVGDVLPPDSGDVEVVLGKFASADIDVDALAPGRRTGGESSCRVLE